MSMSVNGCEKIFREHRDKWAFIYARQSTPAQVLQHRSSTERQLGLRDVALSLGWSSSQIEVIADDLGRSGKFTENRDGFQRLAAEISLGHVGAVFSLDASRLARSSADWHRLLEIAALTRTLLVDEQTVYDPRDPNDRLVLGMKGTMADFELVWLRQRMDGGRWHLVRKGEYRVRPPAGYVYADDESTRLVLDADEEIRRAVALLFERYRLGGTTSDVVRYFRAHGLRFPSRFGKRVVWRPLTGSRAHSILINPFYTGAYVFGRTRRETSLEDGQRRQHVRTIPMADWPVMIKDAHPAYLSWEEYVANRKRMSEAGPRRRDGTVQGAAREGRALLQGMLLCGNCGNRLHVRYRGQNGRYAAYQCTRLLAEGLGRYCQVIQSRNLDEPVVDLVLATLTRDALADATRVVEIVEQQDAALEQQWRLRLERARYEATRAERQYDACEPENRVVARTLEARWNERLVEAERLEHEYQELQRSRRFQLSDIERQRVLQLAEDLPKLWHATTTADRDRKLLLRLLIKEIAVRLIDVPRPSLRVRILWHTGAVTELDVDRLGGGGTPGKRIRSRVLATTIGDLPSEKSQGAP
jgi:DNA invertase Pin-like site-specific DNA recombinase